MGLQWWRKNQSWLKSKYPALWTLLQRTKVAGSHGGSKGDKVWTKFLLDWQYTKRREHLGYRYKWNDDGSYTVVRRLVVGCKRYLGKAKRGEWQTGPSSATNQCKGSGARNVWSISSRSVNNLCYPGLAKRSAKRSAMCHTRTPVSVRISKFTLSKPKRAPSDGLAQGLLGSPEMVMLRGYRSIVPRKYATSWSRFESEETDGMVGVQRVKWSINEVVEYCEKPQSKKGLAAQQAAVYNEEKSWPRKRHETGRMKWLPIQVVKQQRKGSEVMVNSFTLMTQDKRLRVVCHTPLAQGTIEGINLAPTDTKCDIVIHRWQYSLRCPEGKLRGLALQTSVLSRYDDAEKPKVVDTGSGASAYQVYVNGHKTSLKFQRTARLKTLSKRSWNSRGSVNVRMRISKPHWIPSQQYQSHRHYAFSFGVSQKDRISASELFWDPQMSSHFQSEPNSFETPQSLMEASVYSSAGSRNAGLGYAVMAFVMALTLMFQRRMEH